MISASHQHFSQLAVERSQRVRHARLLCRCGSRYDSVSAVRSMPVVQGREWGVSAEHTIVFVLVRLRRVICGGATTAVRFILESTRFMSTMPRPAVSAEFVSSDQLRSDFSRAMSDMYRREVPAYGTLIELVEAINQRVLANDPQLKARLSATDNLQRISEERHGAIRLGTAQELRMIARVFAVMGMQPVGYYDLTQANVPVHSTAFRCVDAQSLAKSPFRVFTSLLRTELIRDESLRQRAEEILERRNIFTDELRRLVEVAETRGGLDSDEAAQFIREATVTFKWHPQAGGRTAIL